jgi:2-polyprenyl-6-methoxyphenol hydroxylase-like FAD-dependent oxidoreductase
MSKNTDVFVIGGGPAGLAAAIAARQRGFNVTIADGATPPVDKACGEGLMPDALSALQDLGISLSASDGFPFHGLRFWERNTSAEADFPEEHGLGVRRVVLHQMLLERAQSLGVRFLWHTPVVGICNDEVLIGDGTIRARWIVGADGVGSRVRQWCGLNDQTHGAQRYASRVHYRVEPWSRHVEVYWGEGAQAYVTPVGEESVCVVLVSRFPGVRLSSLQERFPELARRLDYATCIGAERGAVTVTRQLKSVHRGAVALVGDASGSVDAITGDGLNLGFRQALALAAAMQVRDLGAYQQAHRRLARRPTLLGRLLLLLDSRPKLRHRAMRALAAHPDLFARLLAVHVGAASPRHLAETGALLGWRLVVA